MYKFFLSLVVAVIAISCSSSGIKEKVNKAGDAAGQVAGEFIEGAAHGVSDAFEIKPELSKELTEKGIRIGKINLESDSLGTDDQLTIYVIFEKDYEGPLNAKVFDSKGLEMGRSKQSVKGKAGDAQFYEFHFDKHTNIESNSKLQIE